MCSYVQGTKNIPMKNREKQVLGKLCTLINMSSPKIYVKRNKQKIQMVINNSDCSGSNQNLANKSVAICRSSQATISNAHSNQQNKWGLIRQ